MKITTELLNAGRSINNSFNYEQLKILGVEVPPKKPWVKQIIGTEISEESYKKFIALKNKHIKNFDNLTLDLF